jgi:cytochrome c553
VINHCDRSALSERSSLIRFGSKPETLAWTRRFGTYMKKSSALWLAVASLASVLACAPARAAEISAGKALAEACAACHGADGVSQVPLTPSLAGQPDEYLQWQLVYFRSGARKSEVMASIAGALSNEDIRNLGAYYASLPPPQPSAMPDAVTQIGEKLAVTRRCKSCHGDDYNGFRAAARLSGQREDVLVQALREFQSGKRIGSGVASMTEVAYGLTDTDMVALSRYMATLP